MRGFLSLLFAAALAAHLGPAGAPSLGAAPACADESGVGGRGGIHVVFSAPALGTPQAEATSDTRERTNGPGPRRAATSGSAVAPSALSGDAPDATGESTPFALLGFPANPTTAPPFQA